MTLDSKTEAVVSASWALVEELKTASKELGIDRPVELKNVYQKCDDLEDALIHMRSDSSSASLELIVGSVEIDDLGSKKINLFVKVSNGRFHVLYPWEALKETVQQWMNIERDAK